MPFRSGPSLFSSKKLLTWGLLILLIFVARATWREYDKQRKIRREINKLHDEYIALEERNSKLVNFLRYYESDEFVEKEAREKMNMAKQGERVVLITKNIDETTKNGDSEKDLQNWQLWLNYLKLGFLKINNK